VRIWVSLSSKFKDMSKAMLTLSQVLNKLAKDKGIQREFKPDENGNVRLQNSDRIYKPEDLRLVKTYRFEGDTDPGNDAVLYVLEDQLGNKGIIMDSYSAESNFSPEFLKFLREIPVDEKEEYNFD